MDEESRRLRTLEQRTESMENRLRMLEDSTSSRSKKIDQSVVSLEAKISLMEDSLSKARLTIDKMSKTLDKTAKKTDFKELEKMFEILSPVREEFVTKKDLENYITKKKVYA
jgi:hypothetical protein